MKGLNYPVDFLSRPLLNPRLEIKGETNSDKREGNLTPSFK
jgi:hypothetical protein